VTDVPVAFPEEFCCMQLASYLVILIKSVILCVNRNTNSLRIYLAVPTVVTNAKYFHELCI
jgi:hypothetical protein